MFKKLLFKTDKAFKKRIFLKKYLQISEKYITIRNIREIESL